MVEIFSAEWLKYPVNMKEKTLSAATNLENLYVVILAEDQELKAKISEEIVRLGINPLHTSEVNEATKFMKVYGSKIVLIISGFSLLHEQGRLFRELVLENTNDTPYAILMDLNQLQDLNPVEPDLNPHVYLGHDLPPEPWFNFLRFDVLTRISLLGEEVKLRGAFIQNAGNLIQQTEELVLCLEENPEAIVLLDTIFGNIHTLKGGSSFLQPKTLERFMHRFEDLINQLRSGEMLITSTLITHMLKILDKTKELVEDLAAEFHHLYPAEELEEFFDFPEFKSSSPVSGDKLESESQLSSLPLTEDLKEWEVEAKESLVSTDLVNGSFEPMDAAELLAESSTREAPIAELSEDAEVLDEVVSPDDKIAAIVESAHAKAAAVVQELLPLENPAIDRDIVAILQGKADGGGKGSGNGPIPGRKKEEKSLKVPIPLLDTLMHISGELTVVRNMINKLDRNLKVRYTGDRDLERMSSLLEELHKLNGSIQTHILDLRKVPVKEIVAPLNRVVRDVSKQLGKVVSLKVQGAELRIDTALAEVLNNTLIHLVRNSLDHGFETTAERAQTGKPLGGTLGIDAYQENDNVYIRIKDDGRGIQTERIRSRAIERGLIGEELGRAMREEDVWQLIFAAGFSTAEKVTDLSGRGIGMSAVKEAVEAIGGEVVISSVAGSGSNITLSMPLPKSVLITRCLFIMISGMQLGVPNENVYRIVHFDGENDTAQLNKMEDSYILSLEDELIPVIQLDQLLGTPKIEIDESKVKTIAVLRTSKGASLGVVVSDVLEFEDTVVKPFTDHLKAFDVFFGTTFLGDGSIGLIFNVDGLVEACKAKAFYRFNVNVKSRETFFQEFAG